MPKTKFEKFMFAFITVIITVNLFVFYCLSIENGGFDLDVIKSAYSVKTWILPIPLVLLELIFALLSEIFIGSPFSLKIMKKTVDFKKDSPMIIETIIICATVVIMCPWMSFIATILYKLLPVLVFHTSSVNSAFANFIPQFLQTFVINFPFALLSQLFFIQPIVRKIFKLFFRKNKTQK